MRRHTTIPTTAAVAGAVAPIIVGYNPLHHPFLTDATHR